MQVALIVEHAGSSMLEIVRELRAFSAEGLSQLREAMISGRPVFVRQLFRRDDPEFPEKLLSFLRGLEARAVAYRLYQLLDGQHFDSKRASEYYAIDSARLATIILTRSESLEQQRRLGLLQEGIDD